MTRPCYDLAFGAGGSATPFLKEGWGEPEGGLNWCIGPASRMELPPPPAPGDYLLLLDLAPFGNPQRVTPTINGVLGRCRTIERETTIAITVPTISGNRSPWLGVVLDHPDALQPSAVADTADTRDLSIVLKRIRLFRAPALVPGGWSLPPLQPHHIEPVLGMPLKDLMLGFESLGRNCEFGLVQRRCAAEPLGLLRFTYMPYHNLLRGLQTGFADLGKIDNITCYLAGGEDPEFVARETNYEMEYHTFKTVKVAGENGFAAKDEAKRLGLYKRKLLDDIRDGEKTFVYQGLDGHAVEDIFPLSVALAQDTGNWLLWVTVDPRHPPGTVELLAPGILRGFIDRLAPLDDAHSLNFDAWLSICANARMLRGACASGAGKQ